MTEQKSVARAEQSASERFSNMVIKEFNSTVGELALTNFQKRLAQNYFISLDSTLKTAEEKRRSKKKDQDPVPVTWANVNLEALARNVVAAARIGLDPAQKNHINMIPYKNNSTGKYDIGFIEGYRGIELKATKYGLDIPTAVIVDIVYSTDKFKSIKKDRNNQIESFEFEVTNEFNRGEIVGGFYYHIYKDNPEKNKLVVMSIKEIEKRKPKYASPEFWGGEKTVWKDGKPSGKEHVDGWYEQMVYKTLYRAAYGNLTIDSQKIDDDYLRLAQQEQLLNDSQVAGEIAENANSLDIDIESEPIAEEPEPAHETPEPAADKPQQQTSPADAPKDPGF